jgi:hypothetical protein
VRLAIALLLFTGCEARFLDQREASDPRADLSAALFDLAPTSDADVDGAVPRELARGNFEGRAGHAGAGTVTLVRRSDGGRALELGGDFAVSPVPGPVLVLTARVTLGTALTAEDLDLGALRASSGADLYPVPIDPVGLDQVFVFCRPFGVEVARATLVPLP